MPTFAPYRVYLGKQDEAQKLFQETLKKHPGFGTFIDVSKGKSRLMVEHEIPDDGDWQYRTARAAYGTGPADPPLHVAMADDGEMSSAHVANTKQAAASRADRFAYSGV